MLKFRDRIILGCAVSFSVLTLIGVAYNDERQRKRRHSAIAKDIEREQWRARKIAESSGQPLAQLDDGFADKYMADPVNSHDVADAKRVIKDMVDGKPAEARKSWWG
jgi:hypothetical protein